MKSLAFLLFWVQIFLTAQVLAHNSFVFPESWDKCHKNFDIQKLLSTEKIDKDKKVQLIFFGYDQKRALEAYQIKKGFCPKKIDKVLALPYQKELKNLMSKYKNSDVPKIYVFLGHGLQLYQLKNIEKSCDQTVLNLLEPIDQVYIQLIDDTRTVLQSPHISTAIYQYCLNGEINQKIFLNRWNSFLSSLNL